jgi:hypothetical protein
MFGSGKFKGLVFIHFKKFCNGLIPDYLRENKTVFISCEFIKKVGCIVWWLPF